MSQHLDVPDTGTGSIPLDPVPRYLRLHYWWAYVHPNAVRLFERAWLVNLILWFNYRCLSEAALTALEDPGPAGKLPGRTLQIACVYGDLTARLAQRCLAADGSLDVVDVLPIQLENLARKLPPKAPARLLTRNADNLALPDASYDRALLFFLLHEQPEDVRRRTLQEALRVVRPGGKLVVVDYARPSPWHPARYLWLPVLRILEPFAHDLWQRDLTDWLPGHCSGEALNRTGFFGGLYQLVSITR
ncbi:MAG: rhodoquinone biosynthesis methyltransferase RquA [Acetobacteraceae bacterium]|jgi:ubiquinone/menaquinone biosynthesis C-methylase UbiE